MLWEVSGTQSRAEYVMYIAELGLPDRAIRAKLRFRRFNTRWYMLKQIYSLFEMFKPESSTCSWGFKWREQKLVRYTKPYSKYCRIRILCLIPEISQNFQYSVFDSCHTRFKRTVPFQLAFHSMHHATLPVSHQAHLDNMTPCYHYCILYPHRSMHTHNTQPMQETLRKHGRDLAFCREALCDHLFISLL